MSHPPDSKQAILLAAERKFAECGYAGTSVQDIIAAANFSKPTLYYYFENKADLYRALVESAYDESYTMMAAAQRQEAGFQCQLVEIISAVFTFVNDRRDLMRILYATLFAAPGVVPPDCINLEKRQRNLELIHATVRQGVEFGQLSAKFETRELTEEIFSALSYRVMSSLFLGGPPLSRKTAERLVQLFLEGASAPADSFIPSIRVLSPTS